MSRYCPGNNDYIKEFIYRNISGTELLKMSLSKFCIKYIANKNSLIKHKNVDFDMFINSINLKAICVFAPFGDDCPNDGYAKRILSIDQGLLKDYHKIYINCCVNTNSNFEIRKIDEEHTYIKFNSYELEQLNKVLKIIERVKITYTHSINMFMPDYTNAKLLNFLYDDSTFNILDVHGDVPNEIAMSGDISRSYIAKQIEKLLVNGADLLICVSEKMKINLTKEYDLEKEKFLLINIVNDYKTNIDEVLKIKCNKKPIIVYSGGLQDWQCICQMEEIIRKTKNLYNYKIFINNSRLYEDKYMALSKIEGIELNTLEYEDIKKEYIKIDYGFILREKSKVNEVSCPTKLFEYLAYGIIPIINENTINIIDTKGIKYITKTQLINGVLPTNEEKEEMARYNYEIYRTQLKNNDIKLIYE